MENQPPAAALDAVVSEHAKRFGLEPDPLKEAVVEELRALVAKEIAKGAFDSTTAEEQHNRITVALHDFVGKMKLDPEASEVREALGEYAKPPVKVKLTW